MATLLGQRVAYRTSSTRTVPALVTHVVSGDQVNLVGLVDINSDWPTGEGVPGHPCNLFTSVNKGTGVGEWQECDVEPGTTSYVDSTVTELASTTYVDSGDAGRCAVPGAGSAVSSPALSTPRRPSTTRPTRVTVYGTIALTSTLLAPQSATVELQADSSSTPTTTVGGPLSASLSGVAASMTVPFTLTYDVPAGHYYQVVQTVAGGAVTLTHINEQVQ